MHYTFHCVLQDYIFHISLSILLIAFESRCYPNKRFILFRKRLTIGQLNVQVATAEIEEQYNLSNIIYIAFQNCYYFYNYP